jgi:hypothetical protein
MTTATHIFTSALQFCGHRNANPTQEMLISWKSGATISSNGVTLTPKGTQFMLP